MNKTEIRFSVTLDENNVPETITWQSSDQEGGRRQATAINLSIWDQEQDGTLKIDLWTKAMPIEDMKRFYVDTIGSMADSLAVATSDTELADKIRELSQNLYELIEPRASQH